MTQLSYWTILITATACGVALGAMFDAHDWRAMVYGAVAATNLALCALNIGLAIKRDGK